MLRGGNLQKWLCAICVFAVMAVLAVSRLHAQASTATIVGTVTDQSGAQIPGATIQVRNIGTGASQNVLTDEQGRYRVPNLNIGNYEMEATLTGFQTVVRRGITLTVGSEPVIDFSLQVGQAQETITVDTQVSQVETRATAVGSLVESTQMRELPLNGRNFTQLLQLAPGVTQIVQGAAAAGSSFAGNGLKYTISGSRPTNNAYLLDGQDLLGWWRNVPGAGGVGTALGVEAIAEFQVLTNMYSPQFGGNGAVINASSRPGTNAFHGSVFEFLRNDKLEARNVNDADKPPAFRRNQFGARVGGPIKRDKVFFFGTYEGLRSTQVVTNKITVPDQCAHQFLTSTAVPGVCGPPVPQVGTFFGTDARVQQAIRNTMALWPNTAFNELLAGGLPSGTGQAIVETPTIAEENYWLGRVDYNISDKDSLFVRYVYDRATRTAPANNIPLWPELDFSRHHFILAEYHRVISPKLLNVFRSGFGRPSERGDVIQSPVVANGVAVPATTSTAGIHPLQFYGTSAGRVDGTVNTGSGVNTLGPNCCLPFYLIPNRMQVGDDIIWNSGAHSVNAGAEAIRFRENTFTVLSQGTAWTFPNLTAFMQGAASQVTGQVSDEQAPSSGKGSYRDWRYWVYNFYINDQWTLHRKLTMNIGLRYSPTSTVTLARRPGYFLKNPFRAGELWTPESRMTAVNPSLKNWDPRIGFAYDPFGDHKTSIRAGVGIFHNVMYTNDLNNWLQPPLVLGTQTSATGLIYPVPFSNIPPASDPNAVIIPLNGTVSIFGNGQYWGLHTTAYQAQWNFTVQREVVNNTVATVAYVGSRLIHGIGQRDFNNPLPCVQSSSEVAATVPHLLQSATGCFYNGRPTYSDAAGVPNIRVNPLYNSLPMGDTSADAVYHGLQTSLNRRFAQGLQSQLSYTFSKAIDNASGSYGPNGGGPTTEAWNHARDRGLANYDRRHNLRISGVYQLPYRGKGIVGGVLGNWELTGIFQYLSGFPSSPGSAQNRVFIGSGSSTGRPDLVPGCDPNAGLRTRDQWFNVNCYTLQPVGTYGTAGRDTIIGPSYWNLDNSLNKNFKIRENYTIQFRAEAFNILNHPSFQQPNTTIFAGTARNASAGRLTNTTSSPRQIQLALKILF